MSEVKRASMLELKKEPVVSEFFGIGKFLGMVRLKESFLAWDFLDFINERFFWYKIVVLRKEVLAYLYSYYNPF